MNATDKSRLTRIIWNFAKTIMGSISVHGHRNLEFRRDGAKPVEYRYELEIKHQVVEKEIPLEDGGVLLERMRDKGTIRSKAANAGKRTVKKADSQVFLPYWVSN